MIRAEDIGRRLDRPVVLVGMMGSGKSRLGRMLGDALGLPFVDTDDLVVQAAGATIPEIFERAGESAFRDHETAVLRDVLGPGRRVCVVATGGGAVMRPENAALIFTDTLSIWARADIGVLLERVSRNADRPLLKAGDPEKILRDMAALRDPVYGRADIVLDTGAAGPSDILAAAIAGIKETASVKG